MQWSRQDEQQIVTLWEAPLGEPALSVEDAEKLVNANADKSDAKVNPCHVSMTRLERAGILQCAAFCASSILNRAHAC